MKTTRSSLNAALDSLIDEAKRSGKSSSVNLTRLADAAGVDRTLLYKTYPDVVVRVQALRASSKASSGLGPLTLKVGVLKAKLDQRDKECRALARLFVELYQRHELEVKTLQDDVKRLKRKLALRVVRDDDA